MVKFIKIKNIFTSQIDMLNIEMCNYSVPFDFDGHKFVWVEFLNQKERCLCVYYFEREKKYEKRIDKNFGHISHCKILPNEKLFIVRKMNECEIIRIEDNFPVEKSFKNPGDEIIAIDVHYDNSKGVINIENNNNNFKINNNDFDHIKILQKEKYNKISDKPPSGKLDIEMNNIEIEQNNEENMSISLLDLDGNVHVFYNNSVTKRFNLYEIKEIPQDTKAKQFFSMGYPYFIKQSNSFFAISTDHGVFIIKKD